MRSVRLVAATALVAGMLVAPGAPAAHACSGPGGVKARSATETYRLKTFELSFESEKKAYKRGEDAIIHVGVVRPGREDPLGQGIPMDPPMQFPVEDAIVIVGLRVGDVFLAGFARTDVDGHATVRIPIKSYVPPGPAFALIQATKTAVETVCATVEEYGFERVPRMFRIR